MRAGRVSQCRTQLQRRIDDLAVEVRTCCVRADSKCERKDCNQSESRILAQHAECKANGLPNGLHASSWTLDSMPCERSFGVNGLIQNLPQLAALHPGGACDHL